MPKRPPVFRPGGRPSTSQRRRENDRLRGSAASRGYDHLWAKASKVHIRDNPLCRYCEVFDDRVEPATCTDHLYPHRNQLYPDVLWERIWWVPSCDTCHAGRKQAIERQGPAALDALARRLGLPTFSEKRQSRPDRT